VEVPRHCDAIAARIGGVRWMTNDIVNVVGTSGGAAIAALAAAGWT
jgi:predicted acylesterase/phospholipase RssA